MKTTIFVLIIALMAAAPLVVRWDLGSTVTNAERYIGREP